MATDETSGVRPPLWGSARLSYTICAFFAMVCHICLRNTLNFVILCMVKEQETYDIIKITIGVNDTCGHPYSKRESSIERNGDLLWSRTQEFALLGAFYYGYLVALPIAGRFVDKWGGKWFFVNSILIQSIVFILMPFFARRSYLEATIIRIIQGLAAGCGNPAIYQLFLTWAHITERTAFISFAYGGYSLGTMLVFPLSSFLCQLGWEMAFYVVGIVSFLFGVCCNWLVYSTLEEHPRLSKEECDYLKVSKVTKYNAQIPWKAMLTSTALCAFIFTHFFHSYGIIIFSTMLPRFFREAMHFPLHKVGLVSAAPFLGAFVSKSFTVFASKAIENNPNINLTIYRRCLYVACNLITILFTAGIIYCTCHDRVLVIFFTVCIGITSDLAFSGAYWPSLLYVTPSFSGFIMGIANSFGTLCGIFTPLAVSNTVIQGAKQEWNYVLGALIMFYIAGGFIFGVFGSSEPEIWEIEKYRKNIYQTNKNCEDTPL